MINLRLSKNLRLTVIYNVKFGSGNFFDNLSDNLIIYEISIDIYLSAN